MISHRKEALGEIRRRLAQGHDMMGYEIENETKDRTPVDIGQLRNSYTHESDADGVVAGSPLEYAKYVELGTGVHATGEGGSRAKEIPWVYLHPRFGWVTTYGNLPQPHLMPGTLAAVQRAEQIYGE